MTFNFQNVIIKGDIIWADRFWFIFEEGKERVNMCLASEEMRRESLEKGIGIGVESGTDQTLEAVRLFLSGVKTIKGLVQNGIPKAIAKRTVQTMTKQ